MAITRAQQARQMYKEGSKKPVVQGGVDNYLGDQPQVVVPRKWQSGPDKPPTELAYITEAEKKLLLKEDIHGSLKEGPNEGPAGIMSLDSFGDIGGGGQSGADYDANPGGAGTFSGQGPNESNQQFEDRKEKQRENLETAQKAQEDYFKSEEFKKEKKQLTKDRKKRLRDDKKRRQERIKNVLAGKTKNPFGLTDMQLADLKAAGLYDEEEGLIDPNTFGLADSDPTTSGLYDLFEKSDKFSGAEMEAFKEKFDTPDLPGLLGMGLKLFEGPLKKGSRKTKDFFTDDVLGAGKFTYKGQVVTPEMFQFLSPTEMQEVYGDYMDRRMGGDIDAYGNPIMRQDDGGPDPILPIIPKEEDEETPEDPRQVLSTRILGSQFDPTFFAADGGIMNADIVGGFADGSMDEMGRQMYGLGKLVKKATRAVKKIVKSPVGKAALIGAGFGFAGMGPFKKLAGSSFGLGLKDFMAFGNVDKALNIGGKGFKLGQFLADNPYKTIAGLSFLSPLLAGKTDEEKDEFLKDYYAQKLEPGTTKRQMGSEFDFYNYNLAEGGMPSKEPVAKKTMPLLDMGGKEKDYRETGGFVDMGRMERADDVPARLSKNEFVFTADAVRNAGDGDIDKGAEVMYNMMKNLESGGDVSEESQGLEGAKNMFQTSQRLGEVL